MAFNWNEEARALPLLDEEIISSGVERVPICLCLDVSGSMSVDDRIGNLNRGIKEFISAVKEDERASMAADIAIVSFGAMGAQRELDFTPIQNAIVPELKAAGSTPMGEGVMLALDMLNDRKDFYKREGVTYFQPWLVIMSDGEANGSPMVFENAVRRVNELLEGKKLNSFAVAIDTSSNMNELTRISGREAKRLGSVNFREFFVWLSQSVTTVANSGGTATRAQLPPTSSWESASL